MCFISSNAFLFIAFFFLSYVSLLCVVINHQKGGDCSASRPRGLDLVKAMAAPEGRAHAIRGFHGGESTRKVRGVGGTVAGAVPSTSRITSQVSHSGATAPGMGC